MKSKCGNSRWLFCVLLPLLIAGCHFSNSAPSADNQTPHSYAARGIVEQIASDRHQVTVHHEAIPGYMIEMTMAFPVNDTKELDGISPGDKITFTLVVDKDQDWVNNIRRIGHVEPNMDNVMFMTGDVPSKLKPGDKLPDSELVAEDGRHIHLSDFRGKVVAFTFFFTRCPLPTYCPLMNRNFAQTRSLLLSNPKGPTNWEFLSISFDPDFDRPETLSSYARFYRGDNADRWLFADAPSDTLADLGSRLGLMVMRQDASITHNLRTVVIDPQGRLYRQFNDNQWTPRQLADAMLEAAQLPSSK